MKKFKTMDRGKSIMVGSAEDNVPFVRWAWRTKLQVAECEPDAGSIFAANLPEIRACAVKPPAWIQEPGARQQRTWVLQGKGSGKEAPAKSVRPGIVFL